MARTLSIGLTESGTNTSVNEDTFSFGERIYPDMITGGEEKSTSSLEYTQVYVVTQGFGGSGAGDLAGRILQRTARDMADHIADYKNPDFDFRTFCSDLLALAQNRIKRQISRQGKPCGVSFALLLIDANAAYVMNIGETVLLLYRGGRLFRVNNQSPEQKPETDEALHDFDYTGEIVPLTRMDCLRADYIPAPNTMKRFRLNAGDIILLTSKGFIQHFPMTQLENDLSSPDAFAANIRQAQIDSRTSDSRDNRTVLAVKIRDLSLTGPAQRGANRRSPAAPHDPGHAPQGNMTPAPNGCAAAAVSANAAKDMNGAPPSPDSGKQKRSLKTFLLSLLAGFLVGLALIMIIWYIMIR